MNKQTLKTIGLTVVGVILVLFLIGTFFGEEDTNAKVEEPKTETTVEKEEVKEEVKEEDKLTDEENKHIQVSMKVLEVSSKYPTKMTEILGEGDFFSSSWHNRFRDIVDNWVEDIIEATDTDLDYSKTPEKVKKVAEYTLEMQIRTLELCDFLYDFISELEDGDIDGALAVNEDVMSTLDKLTSTIDKLGSEADRLNQ